MSFFELPPLIEKMLATSENVSDLNFSVGRPPQVEVNGKLTPVEIKGLRVLTPYQTEVIAMSLLSGNKDAAEKLLKNGSVDISFSIHQRTRFRVNIFSQRGTYCIVMRVIPTDIPSIESLQLPPQLGEVSFYKNGIVLLTGPTGSGKSSTLAAIIDKINREKYYHIVTIEDPIEFLHSHKNCTINQRELGSDTPSFALALRAALRQAPKVILVGEMRDLETTEIALEASETGHLVLSTLHTTDASKTIDRIIGLYPKNEEHIIRVRLAQSFRYIISQRLLPKADGKGRIAIVEVLKSTPRTREYIEKGESEGKTLLDAMNDGELEGMQHFDQVIEKYIRQGIITKEDGLSFSTNPSNLQLRLSGLGTSSDFSVGSQDNSRGDGGRSSAFGAGSMRNLIER
ncbi:MAG: PilT/PilU family type 4a pilus ATPase [Blastocatellia bacterium]|nr:PilT/PilU family type 4a pilus ATPase [Blastocatellia bacterium]MBL8193194.1 PilT/PilU family type 4a pilus ATPase [Blastocatellia bacterium]